MAGENFRGIGRFSAVNDLGSGSTALEMEAFAEVAAISVRMQNVLEKTRLKCRFPGNQESLETSDSRVIRGGVFFRGGTRIIGGRFSHPYAIA